MSKKYMFHVKVQIMAAMVIWQGRQKFCVVKSNSEFYNSWRHKCTAETADSEGGA